MGDKDVCSGETIRIIWTENFNNRHPLTFLSEWSLPMVKSSINCYFICICFTTQSKETWRLLIMLIYSKFSIMISCICCRYSILKSMGLFKKVILMQVTHCALNELVNYKRVILFQYFAVSGTSEFNFIFMRTDQVGVLECFIKLLIIVSFIKFFRTISQWSNSTCNRFITLGVIYFSNLLQLDS